MPFWDWGGGAAAYCVEVVCGCVIAVLICVLPYPITCLSEAQDTAKEIADAFYATWNDTIAFWVATEQDDLRMAGITRSMRTIEEKIAKFADLLEDS